MQLESVGDLIASRILHVKEQNGSEGTITVLIGRPQRFAEPPDDYFVPYQIVGLGSERVRYAAGVDAVQSLQFSHADDWRRSNRAEAKIYRGCTLGIRTRRRRSWIPQSAPHRLKR